MRQILWEVLLWLISRLETGLKSLSLEDDDKTGIIVAKGDMPNAKLYKLELGKPPEEERQIPLEEGMPRNIDSMKKIYSSK